MEAHKQNDVDLVKVWDSQYSGTNITALKDNALYEKECQAIIGRLLEILDKIPNPKILEIGCGSGELLRRVDVCLRDKISKYELDGVDFSENAISYAKKNSPSHIKFNQNDFLSFFSKTEAKYDVILSQRSIMALMDRESQMLLLESMKSSLTEQGIGIASECFSDSLDAFNKVRKNAGLDIIDKVWHSRYLEEAMFNSVFSKVKFEHFCSTYMLVTRVIYPMFEEPKHNQKIHELASNLPEVGEYSFLKMVVFEK